MERAGKEWRGKEEERIDELWWRGKEREEMKGGGKGRRKGRHEGNGRDVEKNS